IFSWYLMKFISERFGIPLVGELQDTITVMLFIIAALTFFERGFADDRPVISAVFGLVIYLIIFIMVLSSLPEVEKIPLPDYNAEVLIDVMFIGKVIIVSLFVGLITAILRIGYAWEKEKEMKEERKTVERPVTTIIY
ncbi:hypothetical protein DRO02_05360, partial [archaeon]